MLEKQEAFVSATELTGKCPISTCELFTEAFHTQQARLLSVELFIINVNSSKELPNGINVTNCNGNENIPNRFLNNSENLINVRCYIPVS